VHGLLGKLIIMCLKLVRLCVYKRIYTNMVNILQSCMKAGKENSFSCSNLLCSESDSLVLSEHSESKVDHPCLVKGSMTKCVMP